MECEFQEEIILQLKIIISEKGISVNEKNLQCTKRDIERKRREAMARRQIINLSTLFYFYFLSPPSS